MLFSLFFLGGDIQVSFSFDGASVVNIKLIYFTPSVCLFSLSASFQIPVEPQIAKHASLYHQVALVLLPWLLPGSEYLAHELLATIIFSKDFIS